MFFYIISEKTELEKFVIWTGWRYAAKKEDEYE